MDQATSAVKGPACVGHVSGWVVGGCGLLLLLMALAVGCGSSKKAQVAPPAPPPPTYTGPEVFYNTVGSLAQFRNYAPLPVAGYGVVVWPPGTGTGSPEVPAVLRQRMVQQMRKLGIGSRRLRSQVPDELKPFMDLTPERFLASTDTTVVLVQGFIPAGAVRGTPFDVVVSAVDSQTTSLAGGVLWTTELGLGGENPTMDMRPLAVARGPIYLDPFRDPQSDQSQREFMHYGVVIAGGRTAVPQNVELLLNQPDWARSRIISDRINERFPAEPGERIQTAVAHNDLIIRLNVPRRFAQNPQTLFELINHLYIQRMPGFEERKAAELIEVLRQQPQFASNMVLAWRALGKNVIPLLREHYDDPDLTVQLAVLEAGAWLEDERASRYLADLAQHQDPQIRRQVAHVLVHLPLSQRGEQVLRQLLEDAEPTVRIAAYESLVSIGQRALLRDQLVQRVPVLDRYGAVKYYIDRVNVDKPLVYITQDGIPRLVFFGKQLGFQTPLLARLWDNHLILRQEELSKLDLYYQPPNRPDIQSYALAPTAATLAYMLGHEPTPERPQDGLALHYSQVVEVIYRLCKEGHVPAPVELNTSPLARWVSEYQEQAPDLRPETDLPPATAPTDQALEDAPSAGLSARPQPTPPVP